MTAPERIWPDSLMIRDTLIHDDSGGSGRRIYTTAGNGYERTKYVHERLYTAQQETIAALVEALEVMVQEAVELAESGDAGFWDAEEIPSMIASRAALARAKEKA